MIGAMSNFQELLSLNFGTSFPKSDPQLKKQLELVEHCIANKLNLSQELKRVGMTYDELKYINHIKPHTINQRYYSLADFKKKEHGIPVVSFFAGAGGLDLGFEAAGFSHLALVEKIEIFCKTLKFNRPTWTVYGPPSYTGDVSNFEEQVALLSKDIISKPFDGVFIGGPPCQPFSIAANQRFSKSGENFKRVGFAHATNGNLLFD